MYELIGLLENVRDFMEKGGPVLNAIFITIFVLWALVFERMMYFRTGHRKQVNEVMATWEARAERTSWYATKFAEP